MSDIEKLHNRTRRYLVERRELVRPGGGVRDWQGRGICCGRDPYLTSSASCPTILIPCWRRVELLAESALAPRALLPSRQEREEGLAADIDERELFARFVRDIDVGDLQSEPVRPYRRTLSEGEVAAWKSKLADRWGVDPKLYYPWYPLLKSSTPPTVVVVAGTSDLLACASMIVAPKRFSELLHGVSSGHIIEIHEWGGSELRDRRSLVYPATAFRMAAKGSSPTSHSTG